jgi:hypothetical protein
VYLFLRGPFDGRTPNEVCDSLRPANQRPRIEPRKHWHYRSPCAKPRTLVTGKPGDLFTPVINYHPRLSHLPVVSLQCAILAGMTSLIRFSTLTVQLHASDARIPETRSSHVASPTITLSKDRPATADYTGGPTAVVADRHPVVGLAESLVFRTTGEQWSTGNNRVLAISGDD